MKSIRRDLEVHGYQPNLLSYLAAALFSPGFSTVFLYRASHYFHLRRGGRIFSKLFWRLNVFLNGCHISPRATIGAGLCLPHPVAIVIGEGVQIGECCTLYQSVTIGSKVGGDGVYPTIGNRVVIYSGAAVFGAISIGDDVVVAANAVVSKSVPHGATVYSTNEIKPS